MSGIMALLFHGVKYELATKRLALSARSVARGFGDCHAVV